ncbi:GreA/GreB family elongation factor [candidate division WWE3 bacterium]|nr:GreA/GreB family elongation factor [candidate division WWE3 bacterium]
MSKPYLTEQTLKKIKEEYNHLVTAGRQEAARRIRDAIESGGYEDNLRYDGELERQMLLEKKISELEALIKGCLVIEEREEQNSFISIGATVVVELEGEKDEFKIVGSYEADPVKNLISNESPVGQSLLGAKVGDLVEVNTPVIKLSYKILEIRYE